MTPLLVPGLRPDRGFEPIYRRHAGDVYRYALAMLHNRADAEDVTQTTFLNAYRAYQRGERPRAPQNWLITIAHNVCRQRFRQSERRVREVMLNEDVAATLVDDNDAPTIEELQRALVHLPFNQRSALVLRELEGRSYAEIAHALELSVSAVETLLFRARRTLREQLEGSLTCRGAELALSQQLDGHLPRSERGPLRAHLRECKECATLARKQRAQSAALKALGAVPLPPSLASLGSLFGGGSAGGAAAVGGGFALKAAAIVTAGAVVAGVGYEGASRAPWLWGDRNTSPPAAPAAVVQSPVAAAEFRPARQLRVALRRPRVAQVSKARTESRRGTESRRAARKAGNKIAAVPPGGSKIAAVPLPDGSRIAAVPLPGGSKIAAVPQPEKPGKTANGGPTPAVSALGPSDQASAQGRRGAEQPAPVQVFLQAPARPAKRDKEKDEKREKEAKQEKDKPTRADTDKKEKKEKEKDEAKALLAGHEDAEDKLAPADNPKKDEEKSKEDQGPNRGNKNDPPNEPGPPPAAATPPVPPEPPPPPPDPPGEGKDKKK
jgi:RNA polymerase sigma factor (sigma-70 family)